MWNGLHEVEITNIIDMAEVVRTPYLVCLCSIYITKIFYLILICFLLTDKCHLLLHMGGSSMCLWNK